MITVDFTEGVIVFTSGHKGRSFGLGITSNRGWADGLSAVGCLNFYSWIFPCDEYQLVTSNNSDYMDGQSSTKRN